jgi:hypothetical protein
MIRFRNAVLFVLAVSSIAAGLLATRAQTFDDRYEGHLVINGQATDIKADLRIGNDVFNKVPEFSVKLDAPSNDRAIAQGVPSAVLMSEAVKCVVSGYTDNRDNTQYNAIVLAQFEASNDKHPLCNQAVMKINDFGTMTVIFNPLQPAKRFEVQLERDYQRNPIILTTQWLAYAMGKRAMDFY